MRLKPREETVAFLADSNTKATPPVSSQWRRFLGILVAGCFFLFLWDTIEVDSATGDVQLKIHVATGTVPAHPLTDGQAMLEQLQQARQQWIENNLKQDYGEFYEDIFEPLDSSGQRVNIGRQRAFVDPNRLPRPGEKYADVQNNQGPAWERMVRKWTIKLLQVQLGMLQGTDDNDLSLLNGTYSRFVWANGGHSASAGHGNYFRESYTAVLERDLQPILQAIGLDFQARNYAMGGTSSGEEIALCINSIFGKDVDSFTWDYGMCDAGEDHKIILYAYNVAKIALIEDNLSQPGNIRRRPSLWALHLFNGMEPILQSIQNMGLTTLALDTRFRKDIMYEAFPDMFGKTDAEIAALPPYIRHFKCQDMIEEGDPGCQEQKYNLTFCPEREGKASWHPGFRMHALTGHMLSLTVLEIVSDALRNLIAMEPTESETAREKQRRILAQLQTLDAEEQKDYDHMLQSPIPEDLQHYFDETLFKGDRKEENKESMKDLDVVESLTHDFFFCHTAILPAEIRFRGILTENFTAVGTIMDDSYEHGIFQSKIVEVENPPDKTSLGLFLNHPQPERGQQMLIGASDLEYESCEVFTRNDHKDYFYISNQEGWRDLTIPNDAEAAYYTESLNSDKRKGWIFVCMTTCDWGACADGDIHDSIIDGTFDAGQFGKLEVEVNGVSVEDANCFSKCCALRHRDTGGNLQFEWTPNQAGKFTMRMRIIGASKYAYARFSSFLLA